MHRHLPRIPSLSRYRFSSETQPIRRTVELQVLKVVCENEDQEDPLDLRSLVRDQMRALNYAQARGDARQRARKR
jgi:hypothetical protein